MSTAYRVIFVCLVIFAVVGLVGQYGGFEVHSVVSEDMLNEAEERVDPAEESFWDRWNPVRVVTDMMNQLGSVFESVLPTGLNFLLACVSFGVPGMPLPISLFFTVLTVIFFVAVVRVIAGLVTGGGG